MQLLTVATAADSTPSNASLPSHSDAFLASACISLAALTTSAAVAFDDFSASLAARSLRAKTGCGISSEVAADPLPADEFVAPLPVPPPPPLPPREEEAAPPLVLLRRRFGFDDAVHAAGLFESATKLPDGGDFSASWDGPPGAEPPPPDGRSCSFRAAAMSVSPVMAADAGGGACVPPPCAPNSDVASCSWPTGLQSEPAGAQEGGKTARSVLIIFSTGRMRKYVVNLEQLRWFNTPFSTCKTQDRANAGRQAGCSKRLTKVIDSIFL